MTTPVEHLQQRRTALMSEARTLVDAGDLTGDDATRFDSIESELDSIATDLERHATVARLAQDPRHVEAGAAFHVPQVMHHAAPWEHRNRDANQERSDALAAIDRAEHSPDHAKATAEALVRSGDPLAARWARVTSNPQYLTAFQQVYADPTRGHLVWSEAERAAHAEVVHLQRAMSLTDNAGGYMVPFSLDPTVNITGNGSINPVRQIARVVQTATDSWNGVTSSQVSASWDAEAAQVSDDSPTIGAVPIPVYKGAAFVPFSIEVGMDAAGFAQSTAMLLADAKDQLEATACVTGNGTTAPKGFVTALDGTASEVAPTTVEVFAVEDVYKLIEALPPRFQANARWQAPLAVINKMRQFSTGTGPQHAFVADLTAGQPPTVLGKPLHENSNMDGSWNVAASADNFILVVGDHSQLVLVDRIGTTIELVPHLFGADGRPTGQRGYYCHFRSGQDVTTINAFRVLNLATTA